MCEYDAMQVWINQKGSSFQARIQAKNEPTQNFLVSQFYPIFPRFLQRLPDFSLTKFFKVRNCERCGSLNPRLLSYTTAMECKLLLISIYKEAIILIHHH